MIADMKTAQHDGYSTITAKHRPAMMAMQLLPTTTACAKPHAADRMALLTEMVVFTTVTGVSEPSGFKLAKIASLSTVLS